MMRVIEIYNDMEDVPIWEEVATVEDEDVESKLFQLREFDRVTGSIFKYRVS